MFHPNLVRSSRIRDVSTCVSDLQPVPPSPVEKAADRPGGETLVRSEHFMAVLDDLDGVNLWFIGSCRVSHIFARPRIGWARSCAQIPDIPALAGRSDILGEAVEVCRAVSHVLRVSPARIRAEEVACDIQRG